VDAADTFTIAQEAETIDPTSAVTAHINGNNVHNDGNMDIHAQLTRLVELVLGYDNSYYNYDNALYSSLLNRMEQTVKAQVGWQLQPETTFWLGYNFTWGCYDGETIQMANPNTGALQPQLNTLNGLPMSNTIRNFYTHQIYLGLDHNFTSQLSMHLRAGGDITDFYNNPGGDTTAINPYVDAGLRYVYASGCSAEIGFKQQHNATDQFSQDAKGNITTDVDSSIVYATITHAITAKFIATLRGQYQYATFEGGTYNNDNQNIYSFGADLAYHFTQYLSADLGYEYDRTDSSSAVGYDYDRNQVYLGMTASY
jgi:hypothetical protein